MNAWNLYVKPYTLHAFMKKCDLKEWIMWHIQELKAVTNYTISKAYLVSPVESFKLCSVIHGAVNKTNFIFTFSLF